MCVSSKGFHDFGEMDCELLIEERVEGTVAMTLRTDLCSKSPGNVGIKPGGMKGLPRHNDNEIEVG